MLLLKLILFVALLGVAFLLGDLWARESPTRNKYDTEIADAERKLSEAKRGKALNVTSDLLIAVVLLIGLFAFFGSARSCDHGGSERGWENWPRR